MKRSAMKRSMWLRGIVVLMIVWLCSASAAWASAADAEVYTGEEVSAALWPEAEAAYKRLVGFCTARGDETADKRMQPRVGDEPGSVPYYCPIEGVWVSMMKSGTEPMFFVNIVDRERIDAARQRALFADLARAIDEAVTEAEAAQIADALLDNLQPIMPGYTGASVNKNAWHYQYMEPGEDSDDAPMLTIFPIELRAQQPGATMPPDGEPMTPQAYMLDEETGKVGIIEAVSIEESEREAAALYSAFRARCEERGIALLPEGEVEPDDSDPYITLLNRICLDVAEWSTIYDKDGEFIGYSLCIHKETKAFEWVDDLMEINVSILCDISEEEAGARIREIIGGMGDIDEGTRQNAGLVGDLALVIAEDGIRRVMMVCDSALFSE